MNDMAVDHLVDAIAVMGLDALRDTWRERYGAPPPLRSVPIMRMQLSWRVQADAWGGLDRDTRRALERTGTAHPEGRQLGVGARLTRTWKGKAVEVIVDEHGFRWEEKVFASLSAAASAIAGSKWNGPRFFGLRETP